MIARVAIALLLAAQALTVYTLGEVVMRIFPEQSNELVNAPAFVAYSYLAFLTPAALDWFAVEGARRGLAIGFVGVLVLYAILRLQYAHDLALWDFSWASDFVLSTGSVRDWVAPVLTSTFLLTVTWVWAAWRASSGVWLDHAPRAMVIPFALVTLALLVTVGSEQGDIVTRAGVVFYGVALAALACSQLSQSGSSIGGLRSGGVTTAMLIGTGIFAVLGVLLVGVLLEPIVDFFSTPVIIVGKAIGWFLTWVIFYPIAWVLTLFFEWFFSLLGGGDSEPRQIEIPDFGSEEGGGDGVEEEGESLASRVTRFTLAGGAIFLGIAFVVGILFVIAFLRRRSGEAGREAPESERVGNFGEDLRDAARNLFRRERRHDPAGEGAVRLYLDVLESASKAGKPRTGSQTAHEFAPVLLDAFHRDVTDEITMAFEYARYAGRPPDESTLTDLRRRWENRD